MESGSLQRVLESFEHARSLLESWRLRDLERGWRNLVHLSTSVGPALGPLCARLSSLLTHCPDPDLALNGIERLMAAPAGKEVVQILLEPRGVVLETLVLLLATSQFFGDLLIADPQAIELLKTSTAPTPRPVGLWGSLNESLAADLDSEQVMHELRRFRRRQMLRIGINDLIRNRPLQEIVGDLSQVAEATLSVALERAFRHVEARFGVPYTTDGRPARCVALAFGKLGGSELNYSSDIDLMFVYDEEGATRGSRLTGIGNDEFFGRVIGLAVRMLSAHTELGQAYRVDLRLRPEGQRGPLARSLASTLSYYDTLGRTWERQALIKLRPVAGDLELGNAVLAALEPFVYRKYLSYAEINEIKALKRKVEQSSTRRTPEETDVKTGHGGIRDVEFAVQFLQLLNGGELPAIRQRNTLLGLDALERVGCLTDQERHLLQSSYEFLRKTEHRLQLLFDLQTHRLPESHEELQKLARRMGYGTDSTATGSESAPLNDFLHDYRQHTMVNRRILDHLLHDTFSGADAGAEPESDIVLDPHPDPETIRAVLGRYGFGDPAAAYQNLLLLARESVPFLSDRRCRHFLASIAPALLRAVAQTSDPDLALLNLERVSASLGAKGVLWELFSSNPPSLRLYVDLCATSQFLSEILIHNPGMIDELLDSLILNQQRSLADLETELENLCRGASDVEPILHSFQQKELLRIGVRDILGKDAVAETTSAVTDVAEAILKQVASAEERRVGARFGQPRTETGPCGYAIVGLGKLGGREMTYHSDLDVVLVYEADGHTEGKVNTDNFHYFTELAQGIIRAAGRAGPSGRLYSVDMRLRPTGRSGSLVVPLAEFRRYYEKEAALWERQAMTKGRIVHGTAFFAACLAEAVEQAAYRHPWRRENADQILAMRGRQEDNAQPSDLKRAPGGLADIEFAVQLLQLRHGAARPSVRTPNTRAAIEALAQAGIVPPDEHAVLVAGYEFLRVVQARLRLLQNRASDELPGDQEALDKLGGQLAGVGIGPPSGFRHTLEKHMLAIRELFLAIIKREGATGTPEGTFRLPANERAG